MLREENLTDEFFHTLTLEYDTSITGNLFVHDWYVNVFKKIFSWYFEISNEKDYEFRFKIPIEMPKKRLILKYWFL